MHSQRLGFLTPGLPGVFEGAKHLFLLALHTADRPACSLKDLLLAPDHLKLLVPIRMRGAGLLLFHLDPQRVAELASQTTPRRGTGRMTHVLQPLREMTQTAPHPFLLTHGITCRFWLHQSVQSSL